MNMRNTTAPERGALLGYISVPKAFAYAIQVGDEPHPRAILVHAQTVPLETTGEEPGDAMFAHASLAAARVGSEHNPLSPYSTPTEVSVEMSEAEVLEARRGTALIGVYRNLLTPERRVAKPWLVTILGSIKFVALSTAETRLLDLMRHMRLGHVTEAEVLGEIREIERER